MLYLWREAKPLCERLIAGWEARAPMPHVTTNDTPHMTDIPDDLVALVNSLTTGAAESDEIMRSQTLALMYEKAAEFNGDWDKVRAWSAVNVAGDTASHGFGLS